MKCKNCKWWKRRKLYWARYKVKAIDDKWYEHENWDDTPRNENIQNILETKEQDSKFGVCSQGCINYTSGGGCVEDDDLNPDNPVDSIIYSDGESYSAYLYTGEDFGCIHFVGDINR